MIATETLPEGISSIVDGKQLLLLSKYRNLSGDIVGYVGRYDSESGKTYRPYFKNENDVWKMGYLEDGKRPLYGLWQLSDVDDDETIYLVEGEKCADALISLGLVAITIPGGAQSSSEADFGPLSRFDNIVILMDNDESGDKFCVGVVRELRKFGHDQSVLIAKFSFLDEKGDVVDLIQQELPDWDGYVPIPEDAREEILEYLAEKIESVAGVAESVAPSNIDFGAENIGDNDCVANVAVVEGVASSNGNLEDTTIPESEFPVHALGFVMQGAVDALCEVIQAPRSLCAQCVLAAANLAAQAFANIEIGGSPSPITLFFLSVADSGERKTRLDNIVLMSIREYQSDLQQRYRTDYSRYKIECLAYDKKVKKYTDQQNPERASGPTDININTLIEPMPPANPILLVSDMTLEGIHKHLIDGFPSVGVFSDEGGTIIGGYTMNPENMLKSLAGFSNFWDGKPINKLRSGDGATVLENRRLAIHLMVQPGVADLLIGNDMAFDQGFLSRCLIVKPESTLGKRPYKDVDLCNELRLCKYHESLSRLIRTELPFHEDRRHELKPRVLSLSAEAKAAYIDFHDKIERELGDEGLFAGIKGFASKAAEHALRIAATLSIFSDPQCKTISGEHAKAGIEIASFYTHEFQRCRERSGKSKNEYLGKVLLRWLRRKYPSELFTVRDVQRNGPSSIKKLKAEGIHDLLQHLTKFGYLDRKERKWTVSKSND